MTQTIQQQRAWYAHMKVKLMVTSAKEQEKREFRSLARSLPTRLTVNGLGQTFAMLMNESREQMLPAIAEWLKKRGFASSIGEITAVEQDAYFMAQAEAIQIAQWIKLMATALIPPPAKPADASSSPAGHGSEDQRSDVP